MESQRLEVVYYRAKDCLYLAILPRRPAVLEETRFEFYVRHDAHRPDEVVGFEWLGFAEHFPALDEPGIIPQLPLRFSVEGTTLRGLSLKEVLRWAYEQHVLRQPAQVQSSLTPALAMREKPEGKYKA